MAEEYRWHTQQIGNVIQTLNNSFQNLTQMKETYEKIPQAVNEAWISVNAENLNIIIEADIKKYEAVLTELEDIIEGLAKAVDFYTDGEADLKTLVDDISVNTVYKG